MPRPSRAPLTRALALGVGVCAWTALIASAQTATPGGEAVRLSGVWRFNPELSTNVDNLRDAANGAKGRATGSGGGEFGGHSGHAGGSSGVPPGPGGDPRPQPPGNPSGDARRIAAAGLNEQRQREAKALRTLFIEAPPQMTIAATPLVVTMTDDEGESLDFTANGKRQPVELGRAQVSGKTKWDAGTLTQEIGNDQMKVTTTYVVSNTNTQLVVSLRLDPVGPSRAKPIIVKRVYDRVDK